MNAADPASLCGVDLEAFKAFLPSRLPSTHLVFHGEHPVLLSRRRGKELTIEAAPDDPRLPDYVEPLKNLLAREFQPASSIEVETINGEPARKSDYLAALGKVFRVVRETRSIKLWKCYGV